PVSPPAMSQTCLSPMKMSVNCSAMGDDMEFTLSLDNNLIIQTKVESGKNRSISDVIISLYGQLQGDLVCDVQNKVSSKRTVSHLSRCKDTNVVTVAVTSVICVLLLLSAFAFGIKSLNKKRSLATPRKDSPDLVYSDVRVTRAACKLDG
ncbi:hypothetical protein CHARACLAT_017542, partial [Characodon lateralis]|nr:hypothetical protein [Characodon lateralis]